MPASALACQSTGSVAWNAAASWTCGRVPTAADDVTIAAGHTVTLNTNGVALSLTVDGTLDMNAGTASRTLTVSGPVTINTGGTITLSNPDGIARTHTLRIAGDFVNDGTFTTSNANDSTSVEFNGTSPQALGGTTAIAFSNVTVNTGVAVNLGQNCSVLTNRTFTVNGSLYTGAYIVSGAGSFSLPAGGTLGIGDPNGIVSVLATLSGNIQTTTARSFSAAANYVYNGAADQVTGSGYPTGLTGDLIINNPGNTVTIDTARTIGNGGLINIQDGTLAASAALTMSGTSSIIRSGGSMAVTPSAGGNYNVTYTGNSMSTTSELAGTELNNVTVNLNAGQTLTLDADRSPDGTLAISAGTFDLSTFTINRSVAGGTLSIAAGATLKIGGTNTFPANYNTHTLNVGSTVEYAGTDQAVPALNSGSYGNLTTSGSGTKTLGGSETVAGIFTLGSGTTFAVGTSTLTLTGPVSCGGALTSGATGTVSYNRGSAGQNVCAGTYGNLTFNNQNKILASSGVIGIARTFTTGTATGHTVTGSTIDFNAAGAQTIPNFSYYHLTSTTGTRTLGTAINVAGNWTNNGGAIAPGTGTVTFNGTSLQTISGNVSAFNNLTVNSSASVDVPAVNPPTVAATLTNNGTLQQTQTVNNAAISFLTISTDRYRGVDIDTTSSAADLGSVTVTVRGNSGATCTNTGGGSPNYVFRCYDITPTNQGAARVTLWAITSEQHGIPTGNLAGYHYTASGWAPLTNIAAGTASNNYIYAAGDTTGFSGYLLGDVINSPTAVQLVSLKALGGSSAWAWAAALAAMMGLFFTAWKLRILKV